MKTDKRLHRSNHKILGGVCAGLAEHFGIDITLFRIFYVIFSIMSVAFPGAVVYVILWIIMPNERQAL